MGAKLGDYLDFTFFHSPEETFGNRFFFFIQAFILGCNHQALANTGTEGVTSGRRNKDLRKCAGEEFKVEHCSWELLFRHTYHPSWAGMGKRSHRYESVKFVAIACELFRVLR